MITWLKASGLKYLSLALILTGLILIGLSYYQQFSSELWYWLASQQKMHYSVDPTLPGTETNVVNIKPASMDFGLVIEKINVNQAVATDIDPYDEAIYGPILTKIGVAQAKGTVKPGQPGLTYLFGHSTINLWQIGAHQAPFTLLNKLDRGDRVVMYYQGQRYDYFVADKQVVAPTDIEVMHQHPDKPTLILQTCDPPGENSKRLLVIAQMKHHPQQDNPQSSPSASLQ